MKNCGDWIVMVKEDRDGAFAYKRKLETARNVLERVYGETITGTPEETLEKFRREVGRGLADTVLASLINRSAWDGRIDKRVAEWAAAIPEAWDEEAAVKLGLYTNRIHMAHLNQIGNAARKAG